MADEITYDRVEEAEDAIIKAISGVGDTVNDLPSSLEADFTEVKEAISDVKVDVGNVNTAVGGVKEDTTSIKTSIDNSTLFNANSVIKSIQSGRFLKQNPTQSSQYTISISKVNVDKSLLLLNNEFYGTSASDRLYYVSTELSRSGDSIVIKCEEASTFSSFEWQVVEFY